MPISFELGYLLQIYSTLGETFFGRYLTSILFDNMKFWQDVESNISVRVSIYGKQVDIIYVIFFRTGQASNFEEISVCRESHEYFPIFSNRAVAQHCNVVYCSDDVRLLGSLCVILSQWNWRPWWISKWKWILQTHFEYSLSFRTFFSQTSTLRSKVMCCIRRYVISAVVYLALICGPQLQAWLRALFNSSRKIARVLLLQWASPAADGINTNFAWKLKKLIYHQFSLVETVPSDILHDIVHRTEYYEKRLLIYITNN